MDDLFMPHERDAFSSNQQELVELVKVDSLPRCILIWNADTSSCIMHSRSIQRIREGLIRGPRICACLVVLGIQFIQTSHVRAQRIPTIAFPSVESSQKLLSVRDDFISRLSPFDRSARLKANHPVSEAAYLAFVGS